MTGRDVILRASRSMKHLRKVRNALVVLLVLGLVAVALWPEAELVDVGVVERGVVRETLQAEGRTRVRERYAIAAPLAAVARRLELEPGDAVEAGQVVAVLDALPAPPLDARARAEAEARVGAAESAVAAAEEELHALEVVARQAGAEATRFAQLLGDGQVTVEASEQAESAALRAERVVAAARYRVATGKHELEAARAVLAFDSRSDTQAAVLELRAPAAGLLLRRFYESARPVAPGEVLLEIGDASALEVEVDVLSADAVRITEGMTVELVRWGNDAPLVARVRRIEPGGFTKFSALGVEEQRVWVILDFVDPPPEARRLGDAYRVHARFLLRVAEDVLHAPSSAIFRHESGHAAFTIAEGRAQRVEVELGIVGGGSTEIRSGLEEGAPVIVHPARELEDGVRVRLR